MSGASTALRTPRKEEVRRFWQRRPCGAKHSCALEGSPEFFAQVERSRDELEPFITYYARFAETADQRVLEIGTGLGTDLVKFARAGARVTGIDLTEKAISLTRARLALEGLDGELMIADAEQLPFADDSFDMVYSWGVLHHTPEPGRAIAEAIRVLRPGGRMCVMLYARRSWVAFALWVRYALLAGRPTDRIRRVIASHMESVGTKAYTTREAQVMFASLHDVRLTHQGTPYDRRIVGPVAAHTGAWLGWFLVIEGRKAA